MKRFFWKSIRLVAALAVVSTVCATQAGTVTLTALDTGFVTEMGGSAKGDGTISGATYNYSVGREVHYSDGSLGAGFAYMDRKNYFVFDLSTVTGPITSATLKVYMGPAIAPPYPGGMHGYESMDPMEVFVLKESTAPAPTLALIGDLLTLNGVGSSEFDSPADPGVLKAMDLYMKLGDGPMVLGSAVVSSTDDGTILSIPITPGGLGYISIFSGSTLVLAGELPSAVDPFPVPELTAQEIFGYTGPDIPGGDVLTPTLEVTFVPEPTSLALLGLGGLLLTRRRRAA